jgi:nondiscriminating glutamyl-tRNA synthetase
MAETKEIPVRVRMAPSPTGPLHVGGAHTALFNWLFARQHGGTFVLRIEDTDKERSEEKYEHELLDGLSWLGLDWDEGPLADGSRLPGMDEQGPYGPYRQSKRTPIYKKYLEELLAKGDAYYCYCSKEDLEAQRSAMASQGLAPKYNGHCRNLQAPPEGKRSEVIRFKVPQTTVEFKDMVKGKIAFDASLFGDIAIAKDTETPLYNFAVVVDDELMKISHVIRGEEHLSNTPKQILMQRALGFSEPTYAHIPLILNSDRSKMSKRFGDTALAQYREKGYLPEALFNFLALLGWHPKDDKEILSKKDLIREFSLERVQRAGAVFNQEKLDWLNREYMKRLNAKEIVQALIPMLQKEGFAGAEEFLEKLVAVERSRASTLDDFIEQSRFFFELPKHDPNMLVWKESSPEEALAALGEARTELGKLDGSNFHKETLSQTMAYITAERKRGAVLWPLRVALSGQKASPDPLDIMEVLGKDESLRRIDLAIAQLKKQ